MLPLQTPNKLGWRWGAIWFGWVLCLAAFLPGQTWAADSPEPSTAAKSSVTGKSGSQLAFGWENLLPLGENLLASAQKSCCGEPSAEPATEAATANANPTDGQPTSADAATDAPESKGAQSTSRLVTPEPRPQEKAERGVWRPLFNGKDLEGWVPKIRGYPLGENYGNTFRVENGVLKVVYDPEYYPQFENRFGHLFYREKFSHYRLRVEYRFVGEQCPGGPGWAFRNSGIMLHCQDPNTMTVEQSFPVCIEVQLLGGGGTGRRPTANLCTPGTHVVMDGKLFTPHCTSSRSKTYHGDQWVTVEVEVHGAGTIRHYVNGELVLEYEKPQLDDGDPDAKRLLAAGISRLLHEGYISLQSESHPIEFRKVEIMILPDSPEN